MTLEFDPDVLAEMGPLMAARPAEAEPPPVGDVATRRITGRDTFAQLASVRAPVEGVRTDDHVVPGTDGCTLTATWYRPAEIAPGDSTAAALYLHGGGMILGLEHTRELYDSVVRGYVAASGVPMLMVDYRVAPEFPHPQPLDDCRASLRWLADHAGELGVDPRRLAVMGDSAGGGLAAGVCLAARDDGIPVAAQLLVYPMLDDRTTAADPLLTPFLTWTYDDNATGWQALLGTRAGTADVPPYAAPARAVDLHGLPPTYLEVGELDVFRREVLAYADALGRAGVSVELHQYPGCPHASDLLAPNAGSTQRALADRVRRLRSL
ncbi:esterase/lipase [Mycolicibacterium chubuense NBB4]|uniref:Esterase/lipase n=1 Tax=Mycolicibacterium chubuense (strain NBB4) TaxID=710421 RepID=I4BIZ9_MYCCN|nr:alpha/beta hydrolase [Mycolicibacterium chubuense]AFM17256.1 esterase/lipase [Mycolicibacterium chubuense NBB4]